MYIPAHYQETDVAVLHALIKAHPLGAWVTQAGGALVVNHIPFLIDHSRGDFGTLIGHVARPNPVWKQFSQDVPSVVIFQGPGSYISPSWYPTKRETGKAVPTWNYAVVHAHGIPALFDDRDRLLAHVTALTNTHESPFEAPWQVSDAPRDFIDSMLKGIVGIEIVVASLTGKWKVGQNRPEADRRAVADALEQKGDEASREMAALVRQSLIPDEAK
jgi:transcriptional regulator